MSELELLISQYLDGELDGAQARRLRQLLANSPEARAALREMQSIARAARETPSLHTPSPVTEHRLFSRISREGYAGPGVPRQPRHTPPAPAGLRMPARAVPAVLALLATFATLWLLRPSADIGRPIASRAVPEAAAPSAAASLDGPPRTNQRPAAALTGSETSVATLSLGSDVARVVAGTQRRTNRTPAVEAGTRRPDGPATDAARADALAMTPDRANDGAISPPPQSSSPTSRSPEVVDEATAPMPIALPPPVTLPIRPHDGPPRMVASVSAGGILIDRGRQTAESMTFGLEVAVADGQHFSVLGGRAVAVTERRATNTLSMVSRSAIDDKAGGGLMQVDDNPSPYDLAVRQEWWLGLGYGARVVSAGPVDVGVGIRAGVGEQAWRVGGEVPVHLRLGRSIALSASVLLTHVRPHDRDRNAFGIDSRDDGYLYEAEAGRTTFTTLGAEIGVRVALD